VCRAYRGIVSRCHDLLTSNKINNNTNDINSDDNLGFRVGVTLRLVLVIMHK